VGTTTHKLSRLQRWILIKALENRSNGHHVGSDKADLSYGEIKVGFYHLRVKVKWWQSDTYCQERCFIGGQFFESTEIPNYKAVSASISRAVSRLEKRVLLNVQCGARSRWTAIKLTDAGMAVATTLKQGNVPRFGKSEYQSQQAMRGKDDERQC
jgi:hypothetical protein